MYSYSKSYNQLHDMLFFINKHIDNLNEQDKDFVKNVSKIVDKGKYISHKQFSKVRYIFATMDY